MKSFILATLTLIIYLFNSSCLANATKYPEGWNFPADEQTSQVWRTGDSHKFLTVRGDFNGDGYVDDAKILINGSKKLLGLFVFLSNFQGSYEIIELDQKAYKYIDVIGVELLEKGIYRELGEKTFYEGDISFENDSIKYFKFDGAYGVYAWNTKLGKFEFVGLND